MHDKEIQIVNVQGVELKKDAPAFEALEAAVLGSLMIDKDAYSLASETLRTSTFSTVNHRFIYEAISNLFKQSRPIDLLTVNEQLKKDGNYEQIKDCSFYLTDLTNRVASTANLEYHCYILRQKEVQRNLVEFHKQGLLDAYDPTKDVLALCDDVQKSAFELTDFQSGAVSGSDKLGIEFLKELDRRANLKAEGKVTGVPCGFKEVDKLFGGFQPTHLKILAARPGMGKTSAMLQMALHMAVVEGKTVLIFSLEMGKIQLMERLVSQHSGISAEKIKNADLSENEWVTIQNTIEVLQHAKIFIDDTAGVTPFQVRSKARRIKLEDGLHGVFIDYLQLMRGGEESKKGNREQEISFISRSLKGAAKELNVPFLALSQLSRAVETRGGSKRPMLSDLRESGAIEQDADDVSFLFRPEYYGMMEDEEGNSLAGICEYIVAKNRHGKTQTIKLRFDGEKYSFSDYNHFDNGFDQIQEPPQIIANPSDFIQQTDNLIKSPIRNNDEDIPF